MWHHNLCLRKIIFLIIIIISISKEDNVLSMTANLPIGPLMHTDNGYYQTFLAYIFVSDAMLVV